MAMSLTAKDNGGSFVLAPEGLHVARCYALIDLGEQLNKTYGNHSPKVLIGWEFTDKLMADGRPFIHMQTYTTSLSEKSNLRGLLEAWRGKGFSADELKGFKLSTILGAPCYITTKHSVNQNTQKKWSDVISICRLPAGVPCPPAVNPQIYFDLDEYSDATYMTVPEGIRKKINLSGIANTQPAQPASQSMQYQPPFVAPAAQPQDMDDLSQDIPF
ncbi:MAG: hypothetical protein SFW66_07680 [Gammaproteobacteria bacterium]|nr:hypothetical protein [Gammaproteobacteria bacterium]